MAHRFPSGPWALVVAGLLLAGCGGASPTSQVAGSDAGIDLVESATTCAGLIAPYEEVVADVVAREGGRDPADLGSQAADAAGWWPAVRVIAWLSDYPTPEEIAALAAEIDSWKEVSGVTHVDQAAALEESRQLFAERPDLIAAVEADPSVLPESLRVAVVSGAFEEVQQRLAVLPGVSRVTSAQEEIQALTAWVARAAVAMAGRTADLQAIAAKATELGCSLADVAADADLSGIPPGGIVGEWILDAAGEGLPVATAEG